VLSASRPVRLTPSRYPLNRKLDGPKSRSGRGGEESKLPVHFPYQELNPDHPAFECIFVKGIVEYDAMYIRLGCKASIRISLYI